MTQASRGGAPGSPERPAHDPARAPNRLAQETSPYLRQHEHNPVDWYPWGEEALAKAKDLDRPIFLSVGYSSCHWCHVMERESFEDPEIARVMNEHFINIKVDREERPDVDAVYMAAVQMMTGSGGWPMSVFLTPALKPFWGGTYFPPRRLYGRPSFTDVLLGVAKVYAEDRAKVEETAAELAGALSQGEALPAAGALPGESDLADAANQALRTFDPHHGGFGPAPKFPRSVEICMLLRAHERSGDARVLAACEKTLEAMAQGGLYDQIGGGFHRYSTDSQWLVPHFEKMLYDNALLARAYLEAFQATGKEFYREVAAGVLDYVLREMTGPEGGFFSATDADSEGEEGRFFVWTPAEVEAVLGKENARIACDYWNITVGGNFEGGRSIPHVRRSCEDVARAVRREPAAVRHALQVARDALRRAREERVKPFRDEKVITAWNALMISAFARASQVLGEERYLAAARAAARCIGERLVVDGRLYRTWMDGSTRSLGFLDDHAFLTEALLDLYEATFAVEHLQTAARLAGVLLEDFWDGAGGTFFYTAPFHEGLISRRKDYIDNATPAAAAVAALSLLRLERLTGRTSYRERAEAHLRAVKPLLERFPMAFGYTLIAVDFLLRPPVEVVILGEPGEMATRELLAAVHRRFLPAKVLAGSSGPAGHELGALVPLLAGKALQGGKPTAYVCRSFACKPPVTDAASLTALLG